MKEKLFKFVRNNDEDDGCVFEGLFKLPDDGCPGSEQFLRIMVVTRENKPVDVTLYRLSGTQKKETYIGCFETDNMREVSCLLYPTVRLATKTYLEIV